MNAPASDSSGMKKTYKGVAAEARRLTCQVSLAVRSAVRQDTSDAG
ncbi:hypothetical protein OKW40_003384 [Paraburkholderia sp. RAU6.4a]